MNLQEHWSHKGRVVLKFEGVDTISDAEKLIGCEVQIPSSERASLEEGAFYVSDLIGCVVTDRGQEIGRVAEVEFGAGEAPLLIVRDGTKEYMIPFVEAYVTDLDISGKRIGMQLPEGMLELDASLSNEEKRLQQRPRGEN